MRYDLLPLAIFLNCVTIAGERDGTAVLRYRPLQGCNSLSLEDIRGSDSSVWFTAFANVPIE